MKNNMHKIAILYIALGKYDKFWDIFFKSCECHFLTGSSREYYVFTDSQRIEPKERVHIIPIEDHDWPRNTLDRFFFFAKISEDLLKNDFCFFFNANTCFLKDITPDEVLPGSEHEYLVNLSWHTNDNRKSPDFPYERNPLSTACMKTDEGSRYYQGGLIGARTKEFLEMTEAMIKTITKDKDNDFIAINHDESHLNKYLSDKRPLCLSTFYGRPQEWDFPENPAIIFRKKEDVLGLFYIFKLKKKSAVYVFRELKSEIKKIFHYKC